MGSTSGPRSSRRQICACLVLAGGPEVDPENQCRHSGLGQRIPLETQARYCMGHPARCPILRAAWRGKPTLQRELNRSGRPVPASRPAGPLVWARLDPLDDKADREGRSRVSGWSRLLGRLVALMVVLNLVIAGVVLGLLLTRPPALARAPDPSATSTAGTRGRPLLYPETSRLLDAGAGPPLPPVADTPAAPPPPSPAPTDTPPPPTETPTPTVSPTETPSPTATPTPLPTATARLSAVLPVAGGARPRWTPSLPGPADPTATLVPGRVPATAPPSRIVAPRIGLDVSVQEVGWSFFQQDGQEVAIWDVPNAAAGFHKTSAYPGWPGNTVINGHRDIGGAVFLQLDKVRTGDLITVYVGAVAYPYQVVGTLIVPERDASDEQRTANRRWIGPFPDERLTLVTCWPRGSNSHRLLVIAKPPGTE